MGSWIEGFDAESFERQIKERLQTPGYRSDFSMPHSLDVPH